MENSELKAVPQEPDPLTPSERRESKGRATPGGMYRRAEMRARAESLALAGAIAEAPAELTTGIPQVQVPAPDVVAAVRQLTPVVREIAPLTERSHPVVPPLQTPRRTIESRGAVALRRRHVLMAIGIAGVVTVAWFARPDPSPSSSATTYTAPVSSRPSSTATEPIDKATATPSQAATPAVTYSAPVSSPSTNSAAPEPASVQPLPVAPPPAVTQLQPQPQPRPVFGDPVLRVTSDPPGARITVDGVGWGVTPVTIRNLSAGMKRVRATKDGYVGDERLVSLSTGSGTAIQLRLRRRPTAPAVSTTTTRQR